jgi:hypothetical protein
MMRNQKPFMWLSKKGKLYAEIKMHNIDTGEVRTVNHRDECKDETEKSAYDECASRHEVVAIGITIAEPVK